MLEEIFPFRIALDPVTIAGAGLWTLALYLGFSPLSDWVILQLTRWFNFAERSLYTSEKEYLRTQKARESQNAFYASLMSVVPFFILGWLCDYIVEWSLGRSWAISMGMIAGIGCGVYELGRRSGNS